VKTGDFFGGLLYSTNRMEAFVEALPSKLSAMLERALLRVFVAEWLVPEAGHEDLARLQAAAVRVCRQFEAEGRPVRYLRSLYVPGDGRCLCLFEAPSAARVRDVNEAGQLPFARILEAWEM
jgi:hypothetical protein